MSSISWSSRSIQINLISISSLQAEGSDMLKKGLGIRWWSNHEYTQESSGTRWVLVECLQDLTNIFSFCSCTDCLLLLVLEMANIEDYVGSGRNEICRLPWIKGLDQSTPEYTPSIPAESGTWYNLALFSLNSELSFENCGEDIFNLEYTSEPEVFLQIFGLKIMSSCMQIVERWTSILSSPLKIRLHLSKLRLDLLKIKESFYWIIAYFLLVKLYWFWRSS